MQEFLASVAMASLVFKLIDWLKNITNKNWSSVLTQAITWVAGVVVVLLYAQTAWANSFGFGDVLLADMNFWSLVAVGLGAGSFASVSYDFKKARDNTDTAIQPKLIPPPEVTP